MCLGVFHLKFILFGTLWVFLGLGGYFIPHFRQVFDSYLLKHFLMPFLLVFFFWDTYDSNVGAFNVVPEVSEIVVISFNSFSFPLCLIYFYHSFFHLSYPLFCLSYSTVGSLQSVFNLSYCIVHYSLALLYLF